MPDKSSGLAVEQSSSYGSTQHKAGQEQASIFQSGSSSRDAEDLFCWKLSQELLKASASRRDFKHHRKGNQATLCKHQTGAPRAARGVNPAHQLRSCWHDCYQETAVWVRDKGAQTALRREDTPRPSSLMLAKTFKLC